MGEIVDLGAFRKQKEEEEKAKAEEEARIKAEEEQAEIDYLTGLVHNIMTGLGDLLSGSDYDDSVFRPYYPEDYSATDVEVSTYFHEAGYDDDGYYEKSWHFDPWSGEDDEEPDV